MAVTETGHLASREVDELYRRHGGEVYRYAYAVLGNHADAEDVTQTTFLNAYRSLEQGVRPRKPSNWLLTIASNAIKQRFRHEQARPHQVELDDRIASSEVEDDGPTVGELLTALAKIPPQQRQAIVLREFEGRSYSEIAGILGVTTSALETLLFRARRSLAEELEHQLSCTEANAVSRAVDGRLRKERRRLRDHLVECPDCASFARLQRQHRRALRGLLLIPIPLSLTILKGLQSPGAATAATVPATAATGAGVTALGAGGIGFGVYFFLPVAEGSFRAAARHRCPERRWWRRHWSSKLESGFPNPKSHASTPNPGKRPANAPRGVLVPGNGSAVSPRPDAEGDRACDAQEDARGSRARSGHSHHAHHGTPKSTAATSHPRTGLRVPTRARRSRQDPKSKYSRAASAGAAPSSSNRPGPHATTTPSTPAPPPIDPAQDPATAGTTTEPTPNCGV
jgi:RNA polymerase sigma factor (sigma-70 family)